MAPESRELRLLLVTVGASLAVLLGLAQLRFPAAGKSAPPPRLLPLERLGPQALYEDLAQAIARSEARVSSHLVARVREDGKPALALRWNSTQAVTWTPDPGRAQPPEALAADRRRGLLLVRSTAASDATPLAEWSPETAGPLFVAVAEAGPAGPAMRGAFVGRLRAAPSPQWGTVLALSAASLEPGAFVFTFDGRLLGLVVPAAGGPALLSGEPLRSAVDALVREPRLAAWSGVRLTLVPGASPAESAPVLVLATEAWSRFADHLRPGDRIDAIDAGLPRTPAEAEAALQAPTARVRVRRGGRTLTVSGAAPAEPGLRFAADADGARVTHVAADSPGARAGLREGDVLTAVDGEPRPSPEAVTRRWLRLPRGGRLLVIVGRGREARATALTKP